MVHDVSGVLAAGGFACAMARPWGEAVAGTSCGSRQSFLLLTCFGPVLSRSSLLLEKIANCLQYGAVVPLVMPAESPRGDTKHAGRIGFLQVLLHHLAKHHNTSKQKLPSVSRAVLSPGAFLADVS